MNKSILFILSLIIISSCKNQSLKHIVESKEYTIEDYYLDNDSLKQGVFIEFTKTGDTISIAHYLDNKLHGKRKIFNTIGYLETVEHYKTDQFHGPILQYYPDGTLRSKGNFTNGKMDSIFTTYYETGKIKEKVSIRDNIENGPFEEYYENGEVHWKGTFIDGDNEVGLLQEYDNTGKLIRKMDCGKYKGEYICQTIWEIEIGDVEPKLKYDN